MAERAVSQPVYNLRNATDVRNRIEWLSHFYELGKLGSGMPLSFTETRFEYEAVGGVIDLNVLLKDWDSTVDISTQPVQSTSMQKKQHNESGDDSTDSTMVMTSSAEFKTALDRLNEAVTEDNLASLEKIKKLSDLTLPEKERLSEDEILVGIGVHLVKKLTGKAETTWKKSKMDCPCGCKGRLDYSPSMYIGSGNTWHGELDIRSQDVGITTSIDIADAADDETSDIKEEDTQPPGQLTRRSSNGQTVNHEFKKDVSREKRGDQQHVIAQSIVFGWTQFNRYPNMSAYIPTIYIDSTKFGVFIYNPDLDSLLVSEYPLLFLANKMSSLPEKCSGIFILWVVLHHRMFFKKQINYRRDCKFRALVGPVLEYYKELNFYSNFVKVHTSGTQWGPGRVGIREPEVKPDKGIKRKLSE